jgi:hypothetical protein
LLISPKWTLFEGVKDSIRNGSRICVFSIWGHGKLNYKWFDFSSYKSFCDNVLRLMKIRC